MADPNSAVSRRLHDASPRVLRFGEIPEVIPEVRRLVPAHRTLGNWTLGQICKHLADSFTGSMDGFDLRNHRIKRLFLKRRMLEVALTNGIPRNYTVDPKITPPAGIELDCGLAELEHSVSRYLRHHGKLAAHPLFGKMPREVWDAVHCVHCAHHLSFVIPG